MSQGPWARPDAPPAAVAPPEPVVPPAPVVPPEPAVPPAPAVPPEPVVPPGTACRPNRRSTAPVAPPRARRAARACLARYFGTRSSLSWSALWRGQRQRAPGGAVRVWRAAVDCERVTRGAEIAAGRRGSGYHPKRAKLLDRRRASAPTASGVCTADRGVAHGLDNYRDPIACEGGPRVAQARSYQRELLVARGRRVVRIRPVGLGAPRSGYPEGPCRPDGPEQNSTDPADRSRSGMTTTRSKFRPRLRRRPSRSAHAPPAPPLLELPPVPLLELPPVPPRGPTAGASARARSAARKGAACAEEHSGRHCHRHDCAPQLHSKVSFQRELLSLRRAKG